jgi:hypothetical protein
MTAAHKLYIAVLTMIVAVTAVAIAWYGYYYYSTPIEDRFFDASHALLKPSGSWGHGFGIAGSLSMIFGILLYMARKRVRFLARFGALKHWLEFHIFLCTLGPILVLYHTSFKFGGLVAISFWSMVAVFLSGIIGRFIYIQIPRTIEGRELSLSEVRDMKTDIGAKLEESYRVPADATVNMVRKTLKQQGISREERKRIIVLVKQEHALNRRIGRLVTMQKVFHYWHVAHLPFALVMLIIMVIHVIVTIVFGYRWIF